MKSLTVGGSAVVGKGERVTTRLKAEITKSRLSLLEEDADEDEEPIEVDNDSAKLGFETTTRTASGNASASIELGATYARSDDNAADEVGGDTGDGDDEDDDYETGYEARIGLAGHGDRLSIAVAAHAAGNADYKSWGIEGSLRLLPGKDQQGIQLTLTPKQTNEAAPA